MIELTHEPIAATQLLAAAQQPGAGAVVLFLGITREFTNGRRTSELAYEAYEELATRRLTELETAARDRWPIVDCAIVHRLGVVPLAEASVAIVVSSPHRAAAFEAGQWLIDELKRDVPIWKQERYADGVCEWVHPESETPAKAGTP